MEELRISVKGVKSFIHVWEERKPPPSGLLFRREDRGNISRWNNHWLTLIRQQHVPEERTLLISEAVAAVFWYWQMF
jgi:hypothetical protein